MGEPETPFILILAADDDGGGDDDEDKDGDRDGNDDMEENDNSIACLQLGSKMIVRWWWDNGILIAIWWITIGDGKTVVK